MAIKAGHNTQLEITGASTSMTDESMSDTGNGTLWTIDDTDKNVFDPGVTFTVEVDSGGGYSTVSASNYTLRYEVGAVDFDSSQSGNNVRIDGSYLPKYTIFEGYATEPTIEPELLEATTFGDNSPARVSGLVGVSWSFDSYQANEKEIDAPTNNESTLQEILLGEETRGGSGSVETRRVLSWSPTSGSDRLLRAFVRFSSQTLETSLDELTTKSIEAEIAEEDSTMSSQPPANVDLLNL